MSIQQKTREVILKLKAVKEDRGLSLQRILDMVLANGGNISMSSVRKVFSEGSENMVFRYEDTIKPIADVLLAVGENVSSDFEPDETETEALRSVIRLKNSIIRELREEIEHSNEKISDYKIESQKKIDFLKAEISRRDKILDERLSIVHDLQRVRDRFRNTTVILTVALFLALVAMIVALGMDAVLPLF